MSSMFQSATAFNQPLNSWDVSNVTSMSAMFYGATAFDQDLDSWNTGNVASMSNMFFGASVFDGDITSWNTGEVTTFESFAENARLFNQDIGNWNTTSVTTMKSMFKGATVFNQDLRSWDMGGVTTAAEMFSSAALTTANYNKMLYSWAYGQSTDGVENGRGTGVVTDNVVFSAGAADYSVGAPTEARAILVGRGWSITDGGQTAQNVPNAPTGVSANRVDNAATVEWTPPEGANPAVTSYQVRAFITTSGSMELTPTELGCTASGASADSCEVTGLTDGIDYLFDVIATNTMGDSDPSQMQQPDVPAAPIAQSRFEAAKVGWITPPTVGGDPLTYTITATPGGATCTITLPVNTCTVEGLRTPCRTPLPRPQRTRLAHRQRQQPLARLPQVPHLSRPGALRTPA
jgi:surface protein